MSDFAAKFNHPWFPAIKELRAHPLNEQDYGIEQPDDGPIANYRKNCGTRAASVEKSYKPVRKSGSAGRRFTTI